MMRERQEIIAEAIEDVREVDVPCLNINTSSCVAGGGTEHPRTDAAGWGMQQWGNADLLF